MISSLFLRKYVLSAHSRCGEPHAAFGFFDIGWGGGGVIDGHGHGHGERGEGGEELLFQHFKLKYPRLARGCNCGKGVWGGGGSVTAVTACVCMCMLRGTTR